MNKNSEANILVVEDEANIRSSLEKILTQDGYQITAVENGEAALRSLPTHHYDLAIIDLKLPGIDGIEVLTTLIQQSPETVTIILTAHASLETAVAALRHGAHDYLFKPCDPLELRESVRKGLMNRETMPHNQQQVLINQLESLKKSLDELQTTMVQTPQPTYVSSKPTSEQRRFLQQGDLTVDFLQHVITLGGQILDLTPTEFDLLAYLIKQAPRIVSSKELIREVQGYDSEQWEAKETVRSHIYHIRRKIKETTGQQEIIRTVRGVGYTIND